MYVFKLILTEDVFIIVIIIAAYSRIFNALFRISYYNNVNNNMYKL